MNWNNLEIPDNPYFYDDDCVIYNGDCRDILPQLPKVDLVLTDPPYPDYHVELYKANELSLDFLKQLNCRQLIFWTAKEDFPISCHTAIHIWDKQVGCASEYERIYEFNGQRNYKMFRANVMNSTVAAQYAHDIFTGHPSQKPRKLIDSIINYASNVNDLILDPFLGSGTTAYCAKKLNRKCIGIEISEEYCEIAAKRLQQQVMKLEV